MIIVSLHYHVTCKLESWAPSRRHVSTSLFASNGPVGEGGDNPYSNVAIDEASVPVDDLQNHARNSSMLPATYPLHPGNIYISLISGSMLRQMSCKILNSSL